MSLDETIACSVWDSDTRPLPKWTGPKYEDGIPFHSAVWTEHARMLESSSLLPGQRRAHGLTYASAYTKAPTRCRSAVLAYLARRGDAMVIDVAAALSMSPSNVRKQLGRLERIGFVRHLASVGSACLWSITDDGRRAVRSTR